MLSRPKNLTEALFPFFSMYALIGHGVFRFPAHKPHLVLSVIWAILFTLSYLIALGFTLDFIFNEPWYGDDERIVFVIIYVNVAIAVIGVFISWCNVKRSERMVQDLSRIDETLQQLGTPVDYARIRNIGYALTIVWAASIFLFNWVDSFWFYDMMPISQNYLIVSVIHHPVHINSIVAFNFCVGVRLVGSRYKQANKILEDLKNPLQMVTVNTLENSRNKVNCQPTSRALVVRSHRIPGKITDPKYVIQIIKHVHLELRRIAKHLDNTYGKQMAFEISALFVMFTGLLYELYTIATNPVGDTKKIRIIVIAIWILVYFVKLIVINETCEGACTEGRRTGEILHCIDKNDEDSELRDEINQFCLQLMHDPVVFSPAGLVTLGHRFVRTFLGTVTTYLVILIQITPTKSGKSTF